MTDRETTFTAYADEDYYTFYSCEDKWVRRIEKLAADYPDKVKIIRKTDSSVQCLLHKRFVAVRPTRKDTMTEEERERRKSIAAQNLKKAREKKAQRGDANGGT